MYFFLNTLEHRAIFAYDQCLRSAVIFGRQVQSAVRLISAVISRHL